MYSASDVIITGPSNPKRSSMTIDKSKQLETASTPPKFTTLLWELYSKVSADWKDIGHLLEIEEEELSAIKNNYRKPRKCFREMLKLWLKQVDPCPTWSAIIEAIHNVGLKHQSLAKKLRKKYCNTDS